MRSEPSSISTKLCILGFLGIGLWACGQSGGDSPSGGSTSNPATGGSAGKQASGGSAGTTSSGGTGGMGGTSTGGNGGADTGGSAGTTASGGTKVSGGTTASGGNKGGATAGTGGRATAGAGGGNTGGTTASGGRAGAGAGGNPGTGGSATGGSGRDAGVPDASTGGVQTGGTATGGTSTGGTSTGGTSGTGGSAGGAGGSVAIGGSTGSCVKGQTKGNQVVFIGESFIQLSTIPEQVAKDAVAAGSLTQGDKYINNAVSGMTLAGNNANSIPNQYAKAAKSGTIKYVIMDGGGNDCLLNNNGDGALAAAKTLFQTMGQDKIEKVQYFFYPDPVGNNYSNLKTCLDALRPKMQALCEGLTAPKCYWLDLRPTWNGHNEYTTDGIHPTSAGSVATGDAIWKEMVKNCIAQ